MFPGSRVYLKSIGRVYSHLGGQRLTCWLR